MQCLGGSRKPDREKDPPGDWQEFEVSVGEWTRDGTKDPPQAPPLIARINRMLNIHELLLRGNRLTTLPDSFAHLPRLGVLDLRENPNLKLPESVAQRLAAFEMTKSIVLGAPYPSPLGGGKCAPLWNQYENTEEKLRALLEECRRDGENLGEDEEPHYAEFSPDDGYLQLGFFNNYTLIDYDALYQTATAVGAIPYEITAEVVLEFFRTGRLSPKVDWHV